MIDDAVRGAWQQVTDAWTDRARHDELFKLAVRHESFAWVAARYRERGDDPIAKEQLERLRKAALASMMVSAAARPDKQTTPYRSTLIVLGCLLLAMMVALLVTKSMHDSRNKATPVTKPARH
ncbi:MAG TPA: hypothetical protein VIV40_37385 [Kofleriaceae bacterium]